MKYNENTCKLLESHGSPLGGGRQQRLFTKHHLPLFDDDHFSLSEKKETTTVMEEANEALTSVGWAPPTSDEELTSDDPFVRQIDLGIQQDMGVSLEELLNPAKVVNLERDLYNLRLELASMTGVVVGRGRSLDHRRM